MRQEGRLFGRDQERAELCRLLDASAVLGAQVALLEGEPGIGKSALATDLAATARQRGFAVFAGECAEAEAPQPFGLLTACLGKEWIVRFEQRARLARAAMRPAEGADHDLPGVPLLTRLAAQPCDIHFSATDAALSLIEDRCADQSVMVICDDIHLGDAQSLRVLCGILRRIASLPVVVLATMRPVVGPAELRALTAEVGADRRRVLGPIAEYAVAELLAAVLKATPGPNLRAQTEMAHGNPLVVLELVDSLRADGSITLTHPGNRETIAEVREAMPLPSLLVTVLHRLSYLSPACRRALSLAAVLGMQFRPAALAELAGTRVAEFIAPLEEAVYAGLLVMGADRYVFRHDLIREALYGDLADAVRVALHRDAARVLHENGGSASEIAEHLMRGCTPGDEEAVSWLITAARELAPRGPGLAATLFDQAIALVGPVSPWVAELAGDKAVALLWSGDTVRGEEACRRALVLTTDASRRLLLRQCLAESLLARGEAAMVLQEVRRADDDAGGDPIVAARLEAVGAVASVFLGRGQAALQLAARAGRAAEELGDAALAVQSLVVRALVAEQEGDPLAAATHCQTAAELADAAGTRAAFRPWPHCLYAMSLIDLDRFPEADAVLRRGRDVQESLGGAGALPILHLVDGFGRFWRGELDEAAVELEAGLDLAHETGTGWRATARGLRGVIALLRGDEEAAGAWLTSADEGLGSGESPYRGEWLVFAHALAAEWRGDLAAAAERWHVLDPHRLSTAMSPLALVALRHVIGGGDRLWASALTDMLERLGERAPGIDGIAAGRLASRGLLDSDAEALVRAEALYRRAERHLEATIASEAAAALWVTRGSDAARLLPGIIASYESLGAPGAAARVTRWRAGDHRIEDPPTHRDSPADGWSRLTPAEQRVLRLLIERRSNSEIAQMLVVSRRTVETHVAHILAKFGLRSRIALAGLAARHFGLRLRLEEVAQQPQKS